MKHIKNRITSISLSAIILFAFSHCRDNDSPSQDYKHWVENHKYGVDGIQDNFAFNISDDKAEIVSVYDGVHGELRIPSDVYSEGTSQYYPVASVRMAHLNKVTSIKLPTTILKCYIDDMEQLIKFPIPEGLENLAISRVPQLSHLVFPVTLKSLCISGCDNITNLKLPSSLKSIDLYCDNIKSIEGIENISVDNEIGSLNFYISCPLLEDIYLPKFSYIGPGCFERCKNLNNVHMSNNTPPSPTTNSGVYFEVYNNLYVPKGSKAEYSQKAPWNLFKEIIEE